MAVIILGSGCAPVTGSREFDPIPCNDGGGGGISFASGDADDFVITSTGVGNEVQGEQFLQFDGNTLVLEGDLNMIGGTITADSIANGVTTSVLNYNTGTGVFTYNSSGGGTVNFLRADGTWGVPVGTYVHPNHSGQVTSIADGATTLTISAITDQPALTSGLTSSDELLVNNGGVLNRMDISVIQAYMQGALSYGTVTSITAGNGMSFSAITSTGVVTMGTPSTVTPSSTNATTTTSHGHAVSGFVEIVGTPLNNQIGIWTGSTGIEGDTSLTWTGTAFRAQGTGRFDGVVDIYTTSDSPLRLHQTDAGGTPGTPEGGWNYIAFYDGDGDRQGYFGINASGSFIINSEVSGQSFYISNDTYITGTLDVSSLTGTGSRLLYATTGGLISAGNLSGNVTTTNSLVAALHISAITDQVALTSGLLSTDELLVNDGGSLARMDISVLETYMQNNLSFSVPMAYPGAGIALSTGSAWSTSITNNSANWNIAYGWGDHSGLYDTTGTAAGLISTHESTYNHANYNTAYAWGDHAGLYANLSHTHGNITNAGAIGTTANLPIITTTSGVLIASSFGTGANTFCEGDDSRLSDARTPTSHTLLSHTISGETLGHVLAADSATTYSIRQLLGSEISNDLGWVTTDTTYIFQDGLTESSGTVSLGGTVTDVRYISGSGSGTGTVFESTWTANNSSRGVFLNNQIDLKSFGAAGYVTTSGYAHLGLYSNTAYIGIYDSGATYSRIIISNSSMSIQDGTNSTGLQYSADYSTAGAVLGDRWIPDKGYVDSVAGGGGYWARTGTILDPTTAGDDISVDALSNIYLDGGGNTYITESTADTIAFVAGGNTTLGVNATSIGIDGNLASINTDTDDLGSNSWWWRYVYAQRYYVDVNTIYIASSGTDMTFTDGSNSAVTLSTLAAAGSSLWTDNGTSLSPTTGGHDILLAVSTERILFGDGDTYIYESADDQLDIYSQGGHNFTFGVSANISYENLYPDTNKGHDLGITSFFWRYLYIDRIYIDSTSIIIDVSGSDMIFTDGSNTNITLSALVTGAGYLSRSTASSGYLYPTTTTDSIFLTTSAGIRFREQNSYMYSSGAYNITTVLGGVTKFTIDDTEISVTVPFLPNSAGTNNLGGTSNYWDDFYVNTIHASALTENSSPTHAVTYNTSTGLFSWTAVADL